MSYDIGIIGIGVIGRNLVLNIEEKGYSVSVYDNSQESIKNLLNQIDNSKRIFINYTLHDFVNSLSSPRKILIIVPAGKTVDILIEALLPLLNEGDIVIDGGNSYFKDTIRRYELLTSKKIHFLGVGISGGEKGARFGPSLMVGGSKEGWKFVRDIFFQIAAKVNDEACCAYVGSDGAGHYVKMVHNGIEYAEMQIISEAYFILKNLLKMQASEMKNIFEKWNQGRLNSYLIEITANILGKIDDKTGLPLLDVILDIAEQKGTGKWTAQEALEIGAFSPTLAEAVFSRFISAKKNERTEAAKILSGPSIDSSLANNSLIDDLEKALYASRICIYAQGFELLKQASTVYSWSLNLSKIASIWRGGCIIRSKILEQIKEAYEQNPNLNNLIFDSYFNRSIQDCLESWRKVVILSIQNGIPVPAFASALQYYDSYRSEKLPANLIQAQRDYFGAHKYKRIDEDGLFHTQWI